MISYFLGLLAVLVVFSNPISQFLFPDRLANPSSHHYPRPWLNDSLLAIDAPNASIPTCGPDAYTARILRRSPLVMYLEGFLSDDERRLLLQTRQRDTSVRDSEVALLPRFDAVRCIERRARGLQGWPDDLFVERLRTQRYGPGGHYGYHFDWRSTGGVGWGRVSSIMAWVEGEGVRGGGTRFPFVKRPEGGQWCRFVECPEEEKKKKGEEDEHGDEKGEEEGVVFKVFPGNAVYWENFAPDGRGYEETWHAGLPVEEGIKVGLNIWSFGRIR